MDILAFLCYTDASSFDFGNAVTEQGGIALKNATVRVESIEIKNFKNVGYGYLHFESSKKGYQSSILGLYGQNGSGKTALIDAMELLKLALSGKAVPSYFADYIQVDSAASSMKYEFKVQNLSEQSTYSVFYEVSLRREEEDAEQNIAQFTDNTKYKVTLFDEVLSYSYECDGKKIRMSPVIDTRTADDVVFIPAAKYRTLIGKDRGVATKLLAAKQIARSTSRSFLFSKDLLDTVRENCTEDFHRFLMESLVLFGNFELFVINTANTGLISINTLPLAFNYAENGKAAIGNILIGLNEPSVIPEKAVSIVYKVIDSMNIVLKQLVPGLTICVKDQGAQLLPNGTPGHRIQLTSGKNNKEIPLQYESEGIKKLISILQLLIVVYNNPSITVAIDELDSGIFEYLLGELLRILAEKGKGQLIFTSHNLRPLETMEKGCIAFTTTNPNNRYIRMSNVKASNNLRDFYYRDIILGEQSEPVYEPTNNSEIALAFREAGVRNAT